MRKSIFALVSATVLFGCSQPSTGFTPAPEADINTEYVPGQISLDLNDNLSDSEIVQLGKDYGINIRPGSPIAHDVGNLELADVDPEQEDSLITRLSKDPRVEVVEPTIMAHAFYVPNDPMFKEQYGMTAVRATEAWSYTQGSGVVVAVVDTGIDQTLSDLKDNNFVAGYNFIDGNDKPLDRNAHGSHVAGTIAQTTNNGMGTVGLAPRVRLMAVKVLSDSGSGSMESVASGIMFAANNGAQVINLSLGSSQKSAIVSKAVKYAHDKGVFVAAAAGNANSQITGSPAADDGAFAVAATDSNGTKANFSSFGKELKISAPGVNILQQTVSRDGRGTPVYEKFSGTSMSAPSCAAGAALLYSQGITDPDAALAIMQKTAEDKNDPRLYGAGIMDAAAASQSVYFSSLITRGIFLAIFAFILLTIFKKHKLALDSHPAKYVGAVLGSVGLLFFLPLTGLLNYMGPARIVGEFLSHPLPEWDMLISNSSHKWLLLASAFPVIAAVALGHHNKILRSFAGGLAVGTAAYMASTVFSGNTNFAFGLTALRIWGAANVIACLWIAKNSLLKST